MVFKDRLAMGRSFMSEKTMQRAFFLLISGGFLVLSGCQKTEVPYSERPEHVIYQDGLRALKKGKYKQASEEFDQFGQQCPYSAWAPKAQIMGAYVNYLDNNHARATGELEQFLSLHPYHPLTSYALYLRGLCYYEQILSPARDAHAAQMTFDGFTELVNRFPETDYAKDAKGKRLYAYNQLAAKCMYVGYFYQKKKLFIAALINFQRAFKDYHDSDYTPEALHRIVETALSLGLWQEVEGAVQHLGRHCFSNAWYQRSWTLLADLKRPQSERLIKKLPVPPQVSKDDPKLIQAKKLTGVPDQETSVPVLAAPL